MNKAREATWGRRATNAFGRVQADPHDFRKVKRWMNIIAKMTHAYRRDPDAPAAMLAAKASKQGTWKRAARKVQAIQIRINNTRAAE